MRSALPLLVLLFGTALFPPATPAQEDEDNVYVTYYPAVDTAAFGYVERFLIDSEILGFAADEVQRQVGLTERLNLSTAECGERNAMYVRMAQEVIICYELVDHVFRRTPAGTPRQRSAWAAWAVAWIVFHEIGHRLAADLYPEPPASASAQAKMRYLMDDENRADQFATLTMIQLEPGSALAGGVYRVLSQGGLELARFDDVLRWAIKGPLMGMGYLIDEHDSDVNRFLNIVCLTYGADPARFEELRSGLPENRSAGCAGEYRAARAEWDRVLAPHRPSRARAGQPRRSFASLEGPWRFSARPPSRRQWGAYTIDDLVGRWRFSERFGRRGRAAECSNQGTFSIDGRRTMDFNGIVSCLELFPTEEDEQRMGVLRFFTTRRTFFFWLPPCVYSGIVAEPDRLQGTVLCGVPQWEGEPVFLSGTWSADRE